MERVLIDTDVVIEYLRSKQKSSTALIRLLENHDIFFLLFLSSSFSSVQKQNGIRLTWKWFSRRWRSYPSISDVVK